MHKSLLTGLVFYLGIMTLSAQSPDIIKKQYQTKRATTNLNIDAVLDEADWANISAADQFTQYEPLPGTAASQKTAVKILYDDKAIYIGARLYDSQPDSVLQQLSQRDELGITDWFAFLIDAYQDGLNGLGFIVAATGVQVDTKYSSLGGGGGPGGLVFSGDQNWDAVWESAVKIDKEGWVVEMKIPYSAIRFPNKDIQEWNINFVRMIRRKREQSFWNEVRPDQEGLLRQSGHLTGISAIKSPVRLSATPFVAANLLSEYDRDADPQHQFGQAFSGGMDIKYGINDAFTLDMTLIPDFGQVQSDNQVLNLSPFEVRFDENRQFFTEGTELFNKGNLFYSRRVGGRPLRFYDVEDQLREEEEISKNPQESSLYNATKVSGRLTNGLGLGFFNATAQQTFAKIKNAETGESREVETAPLTNYNVIVADQNLKNNSYITLINTHVWRNGEAYDANVSGTEFQLNNKRNTYSLSGGGAVSQQYYSSAETADGQDSTGLGYKYEINLDKISGNIQYGFEYSTESRHYDPNDLGFLFRPNERTTSGYWSYNIFKPFGSFNRFNTGMFTRYSRLQSPDVFTDFGINLRAFAVTKNFIGLAAWTWVEPVVTRDYFEPRTSDFSRFYRYPKNINVGGFISTDYRRRLALDVEINFRNFDEADRKIIQLEFSPRFRFNDKLSFILRLNSTTLLRDIGYVSPDEEAIGYAQIGENDILFSRRDQDILDNTLSSTYIFNNKMSLNLRVRHYWTQVQYLNYYLLESDGRLSPSPYSGETTVGQSLHNTTFNIFNIDLVYRWRFAPGSDFFVVWKNAISSDRGEIDRSYFQDIQKLFNNPQSNSLSFKLIYYLDYLALRKS